jgi:hypothetical protein
MDELSNLDGDGGESLSAGFWGDLRPESSLSVLANSIAFSPNCKRHFLFSFRVEGGDYYLLCRGSDFAWFVEEA